MESMCTAYEQLGADLKVSDSNVLHLTRRSWMMTMLCRRGGKEVEAEIARLLGEKKEMEGKLENVEAEYVANFHTTEAYTNFFDYSAKVGHQEVLAVLRSEHSDLNIGSLEKRFSPPDTEG
ncbi:hypothetical protein Adt_11897 [Abeliophyllum distichum]|uniref:Uncharacterized protein n=1 Tax=Abeliophyllum distichum TaxID=126358 RepID=A0ABD1UP66_9LAMI